MRSISSRFRYLAIGVLMAVAFCVRWPGIDQPLLTFHPTRQYRSAILARDCYFQHAPVPEWARAVAVANRQMQPAGEPPLLEWIACASYRVVGGEALWIPRTVSALSWVLGAIAVDRLALRIASHSAALVAVAIYLFLPYAIIASRSFQPDALMTFCALYAALAIVRYHERSTHLRFALAASAIAIATIVKPMSVFFTMATLAGVAVHTFGWSGSLRRPGTWALAILGLFPATLLYGYGAVFGTFARDQMRLRFVPALLSTEFFWQGWLRQISRVFGLWTFVPALVGTTLARGLGRYLLIGWWLGYVVYAVAFTYHMPTHDYYHLPYVPVVALSVAAGLARFEAKFAVKAEHQRMFAASLIAIGVFIIGSIIVWPHLQSRGARETVRQYEQIGDLIEHDTRVLFLDREYGYPLMYHAQISGDAWPNADDLVADSLGGAEPLSALERFVRDFEAFDPRYFVVTDLRSLELQPDLQQFLRERAEPLQMTSTHQVHRFKR